jgi:hypothetical protein
MSITTGLIHPGNKNINTIPTRGFRTLFISGSPPNVTFQALEAYSAGEIVWIAAGNRTSISVIKRNIAKGEQWVEDPTNPNDPRKLTTNLLTSRQDVNVISKIAGSDWNRLSLSSFPSGVQNTAELIRSGTTPDFGAIVYNKLIPNDWTRLTITSRTSTSGTGAFLWTGLLPSATNITQTTTDLWTTPGGIFAANNLVFDNLAFRTVNSSGVETYLQTRTGSVSNKTGNLNVTSITFERQSATSESIRLTGSFNGITWTSGSSYFPNVLPITGSSYFAIGGRSETGNSATMTAGDVTWDIQKD